MKFQPGQSGNPAGRPPGSRNKQTLALEEAFIERADEVLNHVIDRAKDGEKTAMRLCMERISAPKRERPVAIELPVIESPADARKAIAVVTAELAEGSLTITEATRLIALIDRTLRLVERIGDMERADRERQEAKDLGRRFREDVEAYLAQDEASEARPEATQPTAADPSLYFPVNSENAGAADGPGAAPEGKSPRREPAATPPLAQAA
jgi:hypothetical protein